jgi:anti-anti-sigma factor
MSHALEYDPDGPPAVLVAHARGDIDMAVTPALHAELTDAVARRSARCLVIDLEPVEYIDSSGIELLFRLHGTLAADDVELIVVAPDGSNAARLLSLVALTDIGEVRGSLDAALDRCADRGPG